jgi:hypothetical protein
LLLVVGAALVVHATCGAPWRPGGIPACGLPCPSMQGLAAASCTQCMTRCHVPWLAVVMHGVVGPCTSHSRWLPAMPGCLVLRGALLHMAIAVSVTL